MFVLNPESGQEEAYLPTVDGWSLAPAPIRPAPLARSLTTDLRALFRYWHMDQIAGAQ